MRWERIRRSVGTQAFRAKEARRGLQWRHTQKESPPAKRSLRQPVPDILSRLVAYYSTAMAETHRFRLGICFAVSGPRFRAFGRGGTLLVESRNTRGGYLGGWIVVEELLCGRGLLFQNQMETQESGERQTRPVQVGADVELQHRSNVLLQR